MAQVGGRGRQVQIACVATVLLVAASLFAAPPSGADESSAVPSDARSSADPERKVDEPDQFEPAESPEPDDKPGGKVIYLTFDDGPTAKYTKRILDLLDEYDAKATFFQVGENATAHPELTRAVVERGHALGSHTWNHRDLRKLSRRRG